MNEAEIKRLQRQLKIERMFREDCEKTFSTLVKNIESNFNGFSAKDLLACEITSTAKKAITKAREDYKQRHKLNNKSS